MPFVPLTLPGGTEPDDILSRMLQQFAARVPGWLAYAGHPEVALMEAVSGVAAEDRALIGADSAAQLRLAGQVLFLLPKLVGTTATAVATFTLSDTAGHTIPAGTRVFRSDSTGKTGITLSTTADVVVAPGSATAAGVSMSVDVSGTVGNSVASGGVVVVDSLSFVDSATLTSGGSGGTDDETDSAYLSRLVDYLKTFGATAVTASDFALLARNVAGVARAVAIDGWSGVEPGTLGNEKTVGVVVIDSLGAATSAPIRTAVDAYLQSLREVNFVVVVTSPTFTTLTVTFSATALPGWLTADAKANGEAAVYAYLDPAKWGASTGDPASWSLVNVVNYLSLPHIIAAAAGIDKVTAVTLNGGTSNVTLTGRVPLPNSRANGTTVTGTVT